jgi:uncharacterized membrane protein YphA (DoxX/SURF4 family)
LPFIGWTSYVIDLAWRHLVLWTERVVLGMSQLSSIMPTGSGDTGFLWMQGGCQLAAAFAVALVWTSFDRRRRWDPTAFEILRVCVRYVLAAALLGYGFAKLVPPAQFSTPTAGKLLEPIGQLSPMGMLWTFMGASRAYTVFAGIMETAGGLLLLFRRTTPLGALVSAGVLLNVVILNFCYDVPVKLYSANLLLMSVFLLWPDLRRLARVLVLNRPTEAATLTFPWVNRGSRIATIGLKILVIATIFEGQAQFCLYQLSQLDHQAVPAAIEPLLGIWEVDSFRRDGVEIQPLITDRTRWRRVAIESHFGALRLLAFGVDNSALAGWSVSYGSTGDRMLLRTLKNPKGSTMNFSSLGQERLELKGGVQGHLLVIDLHRADKDQSRLLNWGFHWVSEGPWNM